MYVPAYITNEIDCFVFLHVTHKKYTNKNT